MNYNRESEFPPKFEKVELFKIVFHLEKIFFGKNILPMPIPKFPRNPKIILRNSCDEPNDTKNDVLHLFSQFETELLVYR